MGQRPSLRRYGALPTLASDPMISRAFPQWVRSMLILIFFLATLAFGSFTWRYAVVNPRSQGPHRFVAFEGITALVLVNYHVWFIDWWSPRQIISFVFLAFAIYLPVAGAMTLRGRGKPEGHFEYTTQLVTSNIYHFIRHPMYASLLCLAIGCYLKQPLFAPGAVIFIITVVAVFLTAKAEEKDLIAAFGQPYVDYMKKTARFLPFVI
jgi:protein-S-isoprenylcysteine O-methyltransferase Ste14